MEVEAVAHVSVWVNIKCAAGSSEDWYSVLKSHPSGSSSHGCPGLPEENW